ncbi:MAG: hypothetical protein ACE5ER_11445, partial [Nitrospinaceae bacterium]
SGFNFASFQKQTATQEGGVIQEISTAAQAAERYSLSVQGDLNADEVAAIQALAAKVQPIAENFFLNGEFDFEKATGTLQTSLGVLQEIELQLERAVSATFRFQETRIVEPTPAANEAPQFQALNVTPEELLNPAQDQTFLDFPNVRDLSELVLSVVESEFPARGVEALGDTGIITSLRDFLDFIRNRLSQFTQRAQPFEEGTPTQQGQTSDSPAPDSTPVDETLKI